MIELYVNKFKVISRSIYSERKEEYIIPLLELSRAIGVGSEIFITSSFMSDFNIHCEEIYIGCITRIKYIYIITEIADYGICNYNSEIISEAQSCIKLARRWLEDPGSISKEEIDNIINEASIAMNFFKYPDRPLFAAALSVMKYIKYPETNVNVNAIFFVANAALSLSREQMKEDEYTRQGQFIIDFMKSNKSIFME
jgi:hypothetical protein